MAYLPCLARERPILPRITREPPILPRLTRECPILLLALHLPGCQLGVLGRKPIQGWALTSHERVAGLVQRQHETISGFCLYLHLLGSPGRDRAFLVRVLRVQMCGREKLVAVLKQRVEQIGIVAIHPQDLAVRGVNMRGG